jgi:DNA adenine methylase
MVPLPKYTGNKLIPGVYQKIINNIPVHDHYFELFCGSGSIGLHLARIINKPIDYNFFDQNPTVEKYLAADIDNFVCTGSSCNFFLIDIISSLQQIKTIIPSNSFIFIDPPYLHDTRSNHKLYDYELTNEKHLQLLQFLLTLSADVMIIHPLCTLYNNILSNWHKVNLSIRYHNKISHEALYTNYSPPPELQSYKYIGNNCWSRQAIKRQESRIITKFKAMDPTIRNNILNRLYEIF